MQSAEARRIEELTEKLKRETERCLHLSKEASGYEQELSSLHTQCSELQKALGRAECEAQAWSARQQFESQTAADQTLSENNAHLIQQNSVFLNQLKVFQEQLAKKEQHLAAAQEKQEKLAQQCHAFEVENKARETAFKQLLDEVAEKTKPSVAQFPRRSMPRSPLSLSVSPRASAAAPLAGSSEVAAIFQLVHSLKEYIDILEEEISSLKEQINTLETENSSLRNYPESPLNESAATSSNFFPGAAILIGILLLGTGVGLLFLLQQGFFVGTASVGLDAIVGSAGSAMLSGAAIMTFGVFSCSWRSNGSARTKMEGDAPLYTMT